MPHRLNTADPETLREALLAAYARIEELERRTLEYAQLALELRDHGLRCERMFNRIQSIVVA